MAFPSIPPRSSSLTAEAEDPQIPTLVIWAQLHVDVVHDKHRFQSVPVSASIKGLETLGFTAARRHGYNFLRVVG